MLIVAEILSSSLVTISAMLGLSSKSFATHFSAAGRTSFTRPSYIPGMLDISSGITDRIIAAMTAMMKTEATTIPIARPALGRGFFRKRNRPRNFSTFLVIGFITNASTAPHITGANILSRLDERLLTESHWNIISTIISVRIMNAKQ